VNVRLVDAPLNYESKHPAVAPHVSQFTNNDIVSDEPEMVLWINLSCYCPSRDIEQRLYIGSINSELIFLEMKAKLGEGRCSLLLLRMPGYRPERLLA